MLRYLTGVPVRLFLRISKGSLCRDRRCAILVTIAHVTKSSLLVLSGFVLQGITQAVPDSPSILSLIPLFFWQSERGSLKDFSRTGHSYSQTGAGDGQWLIDTLHDRGNQPCSDYGYLMARFGNFAATSPCTSHICYKLL
jgi:hypothetical protein